MFCLIVMLLKMCIIRYVFNLISTLVALMRSERQATNFVNISVNNHKESSSINEMRTHLIILCVCTRAHTHSCIHIFPLCFGMLSNLGLVTETQPGPSHRFVVRGKGKKGECCETCWVPIGEKCVV